MSFLRLVKFVIGAIAKLPAPFLVVVVGGLLVLCALAIKRIFF